MNERIKNHIRENRRVYIAAGVGIVVGVAIGVSIALLRNTSFSPTISQKAFGFWKPKITQIATQIVIDAPGNSGNVIQDLTTGIIYPSQNAAAKALDINRSRISEQLNGAIQNADGHIFKKIINGAASHELHSV